MTESKTCHRCGATKPVGDFNRNKRSRDGRQTYCRDCQRAYIRLWEHEHRDERNAYGRAANAKLTDEQRVARRTAWKDWARRNPDWRGERDPWKEKARHAAQKAVADGLLTKPSACEECGSTRPLDGHHDSYDMDKWLAVRWLCRACHMLHHKGAA